MKRFFFLTICIICFCATFACGKRSDDSVGGNEIFSPVTYSKSEEIKNVWGVGYISGRLMPGYDESYCVGATDLGCTIYDEDNDILYFAHGDTFNNDGKIAPAILWRSNVLAYKENASTWDLEKDPNIDGYITNSLGIAKAMIEGKHASDDVKFEVTKIPRGGVVINGNIYLWYMSVASWIPWINNYCGVIKSADGGKTWERVYDLTWINTLTDRQDVIKTLSVETVDGYASAVELDYENRVAPNFLQIYPVDGKDGYIYIFGATEGTQANGRLGRVAYDNIEKFQEYEYYTGKDDNGDPIWIKGAAGLQAAHSTDESFIIKKSAPVDPNNSIGEASIFYNEYLGKWVMVFHSRNSSIVYRTADVLWGEWTTAKTILDKSDFPFPYGAERTYGGYSHEIMSKDRGKTIYIVVSTWNPYNCLMVGVEFN